MDLVITGDEMTEPDADQPHQKASVIQFVEQLFYVFLQYMIGAGIGDNRLLRHCLKITVPYLHCYASCEFVAVAEFKCDLFGHSYQLSFKE